MRRDVWTGWFPRGLALSLFLTACTSDSTPSLARCGSDQLLAFTRTAVPPEGYDAWRGHEVWAMRVDQGGTPRSAPMQVTTTHVAESPTISPDGRQIVFSNHAGGDPMEGLLGLWQVGADGSRPRRLLRSPRYNFEAAVFAPDGRHLAVVVRSRSREPSGPAIAVVDDHGDHLRTVVRQFGGSVRGLSWSPDGRRIAFTAETDYGDPAQHGELREVEVASGRQRLLWSSPPSTPSAPFAPLLRGGVYSPDGRRLLVVEGGYGPDAPRRPRVFDVAARRLGPPIVESATRVATWTRDGRAILSLDDRFTVVRVELATGARSDVVVPVDGGTIAGRTFDLQPCRD